MKTVKISKVLRESMIDHLDYLTYDDDDSINDRAWCLECSREDVLLEMDQAKTIIEALGSDDVELCDSDWEFFENELSELSTRADWWGDRKWKRAYNLYWLESGKCEVYDPERMVISGSGTAWDFIHNGVKYVIN